MGSARIWNFQLLGRAHFLFANRVDRSINLTARPLHLEGLFHQQFPIQLLKGHCWNTGGMSMKEHYHEIAEKYESLTAVTTLAHFPFLQEVVQLKPDDVLLDIGGGTGWNAHQLWKAAGLKEPVVCVDPSAEMLEVAKRKEGVTTVQATAEEFFSRRQEKWFTKAMIIGAIHHFSDPAAVLKGVWSCLKPGGSLVVATFAPSPPNDPGVLYFRAGRAVDATSQPMNKEELTSLIETSAPFKVHTKIVKVQYNIPKAEWYRMLRGRHISSLHLLSDQEIEDGIAELERERFGSLQDDDPISNTDTVLLALAFKSQ